MPAKESTPGIHPRRSLHARAVACAAAVWLCVVAVIDRQALGQGRLEAVREDVRVADPPAVSTAPTAPPAGNRHTSEEQDINYLEDGLFLGAIYTGSLVATSPFWAPHSILSDDFAVSRSFAKFPYGVVAGYTTSRGTPDTRLWSAQFSTDYAATFDDLDSIGGHLVVNTVTRIGFDTTASYFREGLQDHRDDHLWLGDGNVTFCFAQDEHMLWRTGLGMNWLNDSRQTDLGFNFTYGFDWFPRRPWVVSAAIDLGSLGHSGFFHFRGTVGAIFDRFETYAGYEYYDFDRVQLNALIGGVRIWF